MAGLRPFRWSTTFTRIEDTIAFCTRVAEFLRALGSIEILNGQHLTGLRLNGTTNSQAFNHSLGRAYRGAILTSAPIVAGVPLYINVFRADSITVEDVTKQVVIRPSAASTDTISLWVF